MQKLKEWIFNYKFILLIFALLGVVVSLQRYLPAHTFLGRFSYYNNYILFKSSILHLLNNQDMYIAYEQEGAWDLYKYSPTFAVFMLPYAFLPDWAGIILWNLTNILLVFWAITKLPFLSDKNKKLMLWFILPELVLSAQSIQSNALIAALFLLSYISFERSKLVQAALFIGIATCIKPYAAIAGIIFLFYPNKIKFILASLASAILFIALPLLLTSFSNLVAQYQSWFNMLSNDYSTSTGISVMALVNDISKTPIDKKIIIALGSLVTFSTLVFYKRYKDYNFRIQFVALLLLWVVIFNHKSESPTFIIPVVGIALWYFNATFSRFNLFLLFLVLIFTQLSASDIFPPYVRHEIFEKIHIKVIPCFIAWGVIIFNIYRDNFRQSKFSIEESIA